MRYYPFVKETTTSTPSSAIGSSITGLTGITGRIRFNQCGFVTDEEVFVTLLNGNNLECGVWAYSATDQLTRKTVHAKLESGTASFGPTTGITLSGTTTVVLSNIATMQGASAYYASASGKLIYPGREPRPATTLSFTNSRVYAVPIYVEVPCLIAGMALEVTTFATTSGTGNLGLYSWGSYGGPGARIAQITSTVSLTTSNNLKFGTFSSNVFLSPGWYWGVGIMTAAGGTPAIRAYGAGLLQSNMLGNGSGTTGNNSNDALWVTGSGTTLASVYTGGWTQNNASAMPCFMLTYA